MGLTREGFANAKQKVEGVCVRNLFKNQKRRREPAEGEGSAGG